MSGKSNPFAERAARKKADEEAAAAAAAAGAQVAVPGQQGALPHVPGGFSGGGGAAPIQFAQGRADKVMTLMDLPDPQDTPDATGDLSTEEEEILSLCMRGIKQFENAWWVMAKSMANINARRLYRRTHQTFEAFAQDVLKKSRPTAYEEITAYRVGELVSARADRAFEFHSNGVSARADIGKKAAVALNTVTRDYGPEAAVAVHETILDATGRAVPVKELKAVITRLPRKKDAELTTEELTALAREIAAAKAQEPAAQAVKPLPQDTAARRPPALATLRDAVVMLESVHRALHADRTAQALDEAPDEATRLLAYASKIAGEIAERANLAAP
jgi:hypothetical protein